MMYTAIMRRISVYISDDVKQRITLAAKAKSTVEADVIREALNAGLNIIYPKSHSAVALVTLARMAKKLPSDRNEPTDVSSDTAAYAFGDSHEHTDRQ